MSKKDSKTHTFFCGRKNNENSRRLLHSVSDSKVGGTFTHLFRFLLCSVSNGVEHMAHLSGYFDGGAPPKKDKQMWDVSLCRNGLTISSNHKAHNTSSIQFRHLTFTAAFARFPFGFVYYYQLTETKQFIYIERTHFHSILRKKNMMLKAWQNFYM